MNFYWLLPIFVLWIGWTKECEGNSSNSSVELSDVPELLNKFRENVGAFAGTGGTVLQKYGVISEKAAAIAGLMTPMGALISTLIGVFSPAPGSAELEAINHLTRMVDRRFDEMNKRIDRAVAEIKHHIDVQAWTSRVREPLINLRGGAMRMLKNNFSNSSCDNMVELCKVGLDSNPIRIVRDQIVLPRRQSTARKKDLSDVPELLNKFRENVGAFAGTGGTVLQKYGVISEKAAAIAGLMTPMGALISTLIGVFSPAPGSAELEAINHLTRMVDRRFDEMNKRIDRAVAEIKHHIDVQAWTSRVREPLINLRGGAMRMLKNNFSNSSCDNMVELCKVGLDSNPIRIVRFMWAQLGSNCTSKKTEHCTQENRLNCTSSYIGDLCVVDNALKAKNYSNDVAEYIYNSSTFAFAELATYQTICSSFKTEEDRKESNEEFNVQAKELLEQLPKIIIDAVANGYWSHVTADFAQQFMGGPNTKENADKAYEALEKHYWWYCHNLFTFVHGELGGYPEISTYGFYTWQPLVITKTVGHEDKKDRIVFTRYRCASDADDESINNNWKNMNKWLDQPAGGGDDLGQKIDRELSIGDDKRQAVEDICNAYGGVYKEGRNAQAFSIYTPHHRTYDAFDGTGFADCCEDPSQVDCDDASLIPCTINIGGEPYPDGGANMMIFGV